MTPPTLARALVRLLARAEDRAFLLEDLDDRFREVERARGARAAGRWYWQQALSAIPSAFTPDWGRLAHRSWTGVLGDVRASVRTLGRARLYAVGVVGTLALGVAAATLSFAVVWRVWFAPLQYPDPDRVVRIYEIGPAAPTTPSTLQTADARRHPLSPTLLEELRAHRWATLDAVSAALTRADREEEWLRGVEPLTLSWAVVSPEGFSILGIVPTVGRLPKQSEREILISERFWRSELAADPEVVGSRLRRGPSAIEVVGVARLPSGYPGDVDGVFMIDFGDTEDRGFRIHDAIARVRRDHSVEDAEAELNAFLRTRAEIHPEHRGWSLEAILLSEELVRPFRSVLALLLAGGATFLLLAAVNVAGLVAARRVDGRHDRSIRLALGASEGQLLRASLVEGLVLAAGGAAAGVVVAWWTIAPLQALVPQDVPRLSEVSVTSPMAVAALSIGVVVGALVGLLGYLAARGAGPSAGRAPGWHAVGVGGRRALVVGQVALTTLLVAGGASVLHRVSTLEAVGLGFDPEGVSVTSTLLRDVPGNRGPGARWAFSRSLLAGLDAAGIQAATAFNTPMRIRDDVPQVALRRDEGSDDVVYDLHLVSPGYFSVMGIALLAGRDFGPEDRADARRVVIVSEELVERYFGTGATPQSAVGRALAPLIYESEEPLVVGVVRSTRHRGPDRPIEPAVYSPLAQIALDPVTLLVRGAPDEVGDAVGAILSQVDAEQRWSPLTPYTWYLRDWFEPLRLQLLDLGVLGVLGLLLACLGLYSFLAYQVAAGGRELGVRKALGARDGSLLIRVVGRGMGLALVGAVAGLAAWYRLVPRAAGLVEGIDSAGAVVPVLVALVVGGSCALATLLPALRATRVDPVAALRSV